MITKEQLEAAGYKYFTQRNVKEFTNEFYQKLFSDGRGKRYYLTVAVYDNTKYDKTLNLTPFSFSPDCQFTSGGATFNIEMLQPESIEQMEDFFDKLWYNLACDYYEKYHENL